MITGFCRSLIELDAYFLKLFNNVFWNWNFACRFCILVLRILSCFKTYLISIWYCNAKSGQCLGFYLIELIYRLGRLPSDVEMCGYRFQLPVGENSIMFYNMTKQIIKPLVNLFLLIQGTAFGLFILQKYSPHDHFENPDKSFVKVN